MNAIINRQNLRPSPIVTLGCSLILTGMLAAWTLNIVNDLGECFKHYQVCVDGECFNGREFSCENGMLNYYALKTMNRVFLACISYEIIAR